MPVLCRRIRYTSGSPWPLQPRPTFRPRALAVSRVLRTLDSGIGTYANASTCLLLFWGSVLFSLASILLY
jgi:hypothetical protein